MKAFARLWLCVGVLVSACTFDSSTYDHAKCTDDTQCAAAGLVCIGGFCQSPPDVEGEIEPCFLCESAEVCCAGVCCAANACCGEVCLEVLTDVENCGGCGIACGGDELCSDGDCLCGETLGDGGPACPSPNVCCSGQCTNPLFDSGCCGTSKAACLPDQICYSGVCECSPGQYACEGSTGCDVDIYSDPLHCRDCETACNPKANPGCIGGTCSCAGTICVEGSQECCSVGGNQFCIDTQDYLINPSHCGGCGKACVPNEACVNGTCSCHDSTTPCAAGKICCADGSCQDSCECGTTPDCANTCCPGTPSECVDLTSALDNCGGCGVTCQDPQHTCVAGACVCPSGLFNCEGGTICVDVFTSTTHCGTCGNACAAGEVCCGGNCSNTNTDVDNCGGCGSVCNGDSCTVGQCSCGGTPVNLDTNPSHCGQCYNACTLPNATVSCVGGVCDIANAVCQTGYANCDNDMTNGCEVNTTTDFNNCGACATSCVRPNTNVSCSNSTCSFGSCHNSFGDCDNNKSTNGCETDLQTSDANCGACGSACAETQAVVHCSGSSCDYTGAVCNPNYANCDNNMPSNGCEVNLTNTVANCGTCGTSCDVAHATGETCASGVCDYSTTTCSPGWSNCDGNMANGCETDSSADVTNCGGCGILCARDHTNVSCASSSCSFGTCQSGWGDCDGSKATNGCETDVRITDAHCGACGAACSETQAVVHCASSSCDYAGAVCNAGYGNCDNNMSSNGCEVNLTNNASYCGTCSTNCNVSNTNGEACVNSVCSYTGASCSAAQYLNCDGNLASNGCEVNKNTDTNNCGACGTVCSLAHATTTCTSGSCTLVSCDAGWADCDNNPATGCEADKSQPITTCYCSGTSRNLQTDVNNCGACGNVCDAPNATGERCTAGVCDYSAIVCSNLRGNCDGNNSNGCEVALTSDSNCGSCGFTCSNNGRCQSGGYCKCENGAGESCATGADCKSNNNCHCNNSASGERCSRTDDGDHCETNTCMCGTNTACGGTDTCSGGNCN